MEEIYILHEYTSVRNKMWKFRKKKKYKYAKKFWQASDYMVLI